MSPRQYMEVKWGMLALVILAGVWTSIYFIWDVVGAYTDESGGWAWLMLSLLNLVLMPVCIQFFLKWFAHCERRSSNL